MKCGGEGVGIGEGGPFFASGGPPLPAARACGGPLCEWLRLPVVATPVDLVPDGFVDGRAGPAEDIAGYGAGSGVGEGVQTGLTSVLTCIAAWSSAGGRAAAHLRQTCHQSAAGQGAPAGPTRPSRSQLVTEAAAMTAAGWRGAPLTWKMTPMAGRADHGAHRPEETVREAACMMLRSWMEVGPQTMDG